jgi:hypothetical protein
MVDLPDFVKEAHLTRPEDVTDLQSQAFADPKNRRFPVHTKADTWLSREYLAKFAHSMYDDAELETVANNMATACQFWDIGVEPAHAAVQKEAADEGVTITYAGPQGQKAYSLKIHNQEDFDKVASDLLQKTGKYTYSIRRDVARQLLGSVGQLNLQMDLNTEQNLQKTAAYAVGKLEPVVWAIRQRKSAVRKMPELSEKLAQAEQAVKAVTREGLVDPDMLDKTAGMLDAVDRLAGLYQHYSPQFQPPERSLFNVTIRDMDDFHKTAVTLPDGSRVEKEALEAPQTQEFIEECLGQKCAADNVVEVAQKLTRHQAEVLSSFLQAV